MRSRKWSVRAWALTASVGLGLAPALLFLGQAQIGRPGGFGVLGILGSVLMLPGVLLDPVSHMSPVMFGAVTLVINIIFYYGLTYVFVRLKRKYEEPPR